MARSLNKVMIIGYTADEPTIRTFPNGGKVANVTVVTNESVMNRETGQWEEIPEWHRVVFWNKTAETVERYVNKGKRLYVEGRLRTSSYIDKNTGTKRYSTEIVANNMLLLDGGRRDDGQGGYNGGGQGGYGQYGGNQYGGGQYGGGQGGYGQNRGGQAGNAYGNEWSQDPAAVGDAQMAPAQGYDSYNGGQQVQAHNSPFGAPSQPADPQYQPYGRSFNAADTGGQGSFGAAPAQDFGAPAGSPFGGQAPADNGGAQPAAPAAPATESGGSDDDIPF